MNKLEQRQWIEIGKMIQKFQDDHDFGGYEFTTSTTYDEIKEDYFQHILGIEKTEQVELCLDDEYMDKLYQLSDDENVTIDEVVNRILTETIEACETTVNYWRLLENNEIILSGDMIYHITFNNWLPVERAMIGMKYNSNYYRPISRKVSL